MSEIITGWKSTYINRTLNFLFITICALLPGISSSETDITVQRAQLIGVDQDKASLLVREKFSWVWKNTGRALQQLGLIIDDQDRWSGVYDILYPVGGIANGKSRQQDRKLSSRLGLTSGDAGNSHRHYQLKLKRIDHMVQIVVQDHQGNWHNSAVAVHILRHLHKQLNSNSSPADSLGDRLWALLPGRSSEQTVTTSPSSQTASINTAPATSVQRAQLIGVDQGNASLLVRAKFSWVWKNTGQALERLGLTIDDQDRWSGVYDILYPVGGIANKQSKQQEQTLLARLGLTSGNAGKHYRHYQLKLKRIDHMVQIVVRDHQGNWHSSAVAVHILTQLHKQLNTVPTS